MLTSFKGRLLGFRSAFPECCAVSTPCHAAPVTPSSLEGFSLPLQSKPVILPQVFFLPENLSHPPTPCHSCPFLFVTSPELSPYHRINPFHVQVCGSPRASMQVLFLKVGERSGLAGLRRAPEVSDFSRL